MISIIILWDHRRVCGPSLTETSLCGSYLYIYKHIYTPILTLKTVRFVHVAYVHMYTYVSNESCNKQLFPSPKCICNGNTLCSLWGRNKFSYSLQINFGL